MVRWLLILSLLLCLIKLGLSSCESQTEVTGLFQDTLNLNIGKTFFRHTYQYPSQLPSTAPKIALSLNSLQLKSIKTINYQIAAMTGKTSTILFYLIFPNTQAKWKVIRLSFWLVGPEMEGITVGYASLEGLSAGTSKKLGLSQREEPMLAKINKGVLSDPKVFVSSVLGISGSFATNFLQFKITGTLPKKLAEKQTPLYSLQFSLQSGPKSQIKFVRFCYILYAPSRLSKYKSHYFSLSQPITSSGTTNLILQPLTIFPVKYSMLGITGLRTGGLEHIALNITLQTANIDIIKLETKTKIDMINLNLLIIGYDMMMSCINCPDSFVRVVGEETHCVARKECHSDEIQSVDRDGVYYSCRKCVGEGAIVLGGPTAKYCGCMAGYTREKDGTCRKIEVYKSIQDCTDGNAVRDRITGKCTCKQGFQFDDFGMCQGCDMDTSYWDLSTNKCACLPGFVMSQTEHVCVNFGQNCGTNQYFIDGKCQCQYYAIKKPLDSSSFSCQQCPSQTFKNQLANQCQQCPQQCGQCISSQFCLTCSKGYFFRDFACVGRCGDGFRTRAEECDDGNFGDGDGCSSECRVEAGFLCRDDHAGLSFCTKQIRNQTAVLNQTKKMVEANQSNKIIEIIKTQSISLVKNEQNAHNNTQSSQIATNISTNQTIAQQNDTVKPIQVPLLTPPPQKATQTAQPPQTPKLQNTTQPPTPTPPPSQPKKLLPSDYKLSVSKSSPIYLSSGIVVQLLVKPQKKRTQQQLNNMFKIEVSDRRALPPSIYISQDPNRYSSVRAYLHYNNQLPAVDFSIKVRALLEDGVEKSLTLYSKIFGKLTRSLQPVDDDSFLL